MRNKSTFVRFNKSRSYKCVFFDLDDTIWDFHSNARQTLEQIFALYKLEAYYIDFYHFFNIYTERNLQLWDEYALGLITREYLSKERFMYPLRTVGLLDEFLAHQISEDYLKLLPECTQLLPYARELLSYLNSKYVLTLVSNGFAELQHRKVKSAKLDAYFSHFVFSESAKALKPDPKIFNYALSLNAVKASDAIMVGDNFIADIAGAQNAGIDQIWLCADSVTPVSPSRQATFKISALDELFDLL